MLVGLLTMTALSAVGQGEEAPPFSHEALTKVLGRFVDEQGRVDYHALAEDRGDLDSYLSSLAAVSPDSQPSLFPTRQEALAYYLNAYNAQVLAGVLRLGPDVSSVWPTMWAGYQFFIRHKFVLGGKKYHLKGLEDSQIRDQYKDPRIHAYVNCASISCPRLPRKAIEPSSLDEELDAAMQEFVTTADHLRVDEEKRTVHLSKIFDWFDKDFLNHERSLGNAKPNLIDSVNRYRPEDQQIPRDFKVKVLPYDKGLNRQ